MCERREVLKKLEEARAQLGLEVHGLLVGGHKDRKRLGRIKAPVLPHHSRSWGLPAGAVGAAKGRRVVLPEAGVQQKQQDQPEDAMELLCTHLHVFKSWTAVGGDPDKPWR